MAVKNILALLVLLSVVGVSVARLQSGLDLNFYRTKCPGAEDIVRKVTIDLVSKKRNIAAALLRMYFHDCFIRGCDASLLLKSPQHDAERDASPNLSLRGYEVVDAAKNALERKCPGVVSCADVLALVARDAVSVIQGPWWPVPLGRRDGRISRISDVGLPSAFADIGTLKRLFAGKGLTAKDLVVLLGAHSIGISSCGIVNQRLYNFSGKNDFDPSMNPSFVRSLKKICKHDDFKTPLEMDPGSSGKFDTKFYNSVYNKKALLVSDAVLLNDPVTKAYVEKQATSPETSTFAKDFADSMLRLGSLDVLTGKLGEIRKKCSSVN